MRINKPENNKLIIGLKAHSSAKVYDIKAKNNIIDISYTLFNLISDSLNFFNT